MIEDIYKNNIFIFYMLVNIYGIAYKILITINHCKERMKGAREIIQW